MLTMIVGNPCVGKSSIVAALIAFATGAQSLDERILRPREHVVFLPGHEEDLQVMTLPRLKRHGADLYRVTIVDQPGLALVRDKERLAELVKLWKASLLIGDPIDSYVDADMKESDAQAIRRLLEAAAWIGQQTGAAVVFTRHPGKDRDNIMPGSRMWRAVPRSILQLTTDGNVPPQFVLSHYKDSLGTDSQPRRYRLLGCGLEPPRFALGEELDTSAEELAKAAGGPTGRFKLMQACRLIRWLFEIEDRPTRIMLGEEARRQGVGDDTVHEAMRLLGVKSVPPEQRGDPWQLVRTELLWPEWLGGTPTPKPTPKMSEDVEGA
jgi:hypothetical protein